MKEWNNPWNPFNSSKVLMWRKHLEGCAKGEYLLPVTVDVDPSSNCNYRCGHCNAYDIIHSNSPFKGGNLPEEHLLKLADFLKEWRDSSPEGTPMSACVAGGGEPLMNPGTMSFLERMKFNGMETGLISNGYLLKKEHIDIIAKNCRWAGFSMDAASPSTYNKIKGLPENSGAFEKVVENLRALAKRVRDLDSKCDVSFKYLIHPSNSSEIYDAINLAKEIGVKDFHMRPVGWENLTITRGKEKLNFVPLLESIDKQIEEGLKLEDSNFRVFGVRHKFNPDFTPLKPFNRCWAIPLLPTFGADGNVHTCFDMRARKDLIMCSHYPDVSEISRFWNSDAHKKLVSEIDINTCPRCTFSSYNEIVEKVIQKDSMCYKFP